MRRSLLIRAPINPSTNTNTGTEVMLVMAADDEFKVTSSREKIPEI